MNCLNHSDDSLLIFMCHSIMDLFRRMGLTLYFHLQGGNLDEVDATLTVKTLKLYQRR